MNNLPLSYQMLLPLRTRHPSQPPKTLPNPSRPLLFFYPSPLSQNPFKSLLRTSASASAADTRTQNLSHQSAIQRIADKLRSLGYVDDEGKDDTEEALNRSAQPESPGEIFVPLRTQLPRNRVGHTIDTSWSTPENPVPEPGSGSVIQRFHKLRREVWKEKKREKAEREGERRERVPTLAELTLPKEELSRLRGLGIGLKKKLKVGKAGITEGIVNGIHERWRRTELVKIVCEDLCRMNMKRTHDLLEVRVT